MSSTHRPYKLSLSEDEYAEKYAELCGYIEAMWAKRKAKDYWDVRPEDTLPVVSPQSRAVAMHICESILGIEYVRPKPTRKEDSR